MVLFLGLLFFWSLHLFLCQYHVGFVTMALYNNLKPGIVILAELLFLFRITFAIQGLLFFHLNFRNDFLISAWNDI
jgi:hypothetical protein